MRKEDSLQLELFSQPGEAQDLKPHYANNPLLANIWGYEKKILIIIGIVITGIISFSLGVEKGKRLALPRNNFQAAPAIDRNAVLAAKQTQAIEAPEEKKDKGAPALEKEGFIIQLASYRTKSFAQKEGESLRKKGLSPVVFSKKGYTVLCVGNFSSRESAKPVLSELKKRYKDCYIRRL